MFQITKDQPLSPATRRKRLAAYLDVKLKSEDETLQLEGAHGLYELAINRKHHADISHDHIAMLVQRLSSENLEVRSERGGAAKRRKFTY